MRNTRSGFVQVDYRSPEWIAIKEMLEQEYDTAVKSLVSTGLSEAEYNQWRGRASLINKLLDTEQRSLNKEKFV